MWCSDKWWLVMWWHETSVEMWCMPRTTCCLTELLLNWTSILLNCYFAALGSVHFYISHKKSRNGIEQQCALALKSNWDCKHHLLSCKQLMNRKKTTRVRCFPKFWTNVHKLSSVMVPPFYSLSPCTHTYPTTAPKLLPAFFGLRGQEDLQMSCGT